MMRALAFVAALAAVPVAASAQSAPPAAAPAAVDPAMLARAKDLFHQLQTGSVNRSLLDDSANMNLDVDTLSQIASQLAPLGAPQTFVQESIAQQQSGTFYTYAVGFKNGSKIGLVISVDGDGKIGGIQLQPAS